MTCTVSFPHVLSSEKERVIPQLYLKVDDESSWEKKKSSHRKKKTVNDTFCDVFYKSDRGFLF